MQRDLLKLSSYCGPCWGGWSVRLVNLGALSDCGCVEGEDKCSEIVPRTSVNADFFISLKFLTSHKKSIEQLHPSAPQQT